MPYNLTNREAFPVELEQAPIIGQYIQGGECPVDYYNTTGKSIMPGEPVIFLSRLMISKSVILPGEFGSLVAGAWMRYLVDPALAANILQDAVVYFDTDLAVAASYIPGYATGVAPTNGYKLGQAIAPIAKGIEIRLNGSSIPIAAGPASGQMPASVTVDVLLTNVSPPTTYGTVQDWNG